ncbi:hypothetical protein PENANT_c067G07887 [Penicillium antarcticum]|uniref:Transcription factor domain-containing protein n=1 Tax=Penicillium antarcticum TaxID=416450 RepID=A0A1V6PPU0_9EURO|nr:hypothetical protein PENANT_c067G07887 [Penicillium antarcticum]
MTGRVSCVGKNSSVPPPAPSEGLEYSPNAIGGSSHERLIKNSSVQWTILLQQPKAQQEMLKTMAPNHSLFFFCLVDLIFISQTSLDHVYNNVHIQTKQVRRHIDRYNKKLDQWHSGLPDCMHFRDDHRASTTSDPYQVSLSLHYYSIRIVLNRPCFTLPKANEKTGIRSFRSHLERNTALLCLRSSLAIVFLLPNSPDVDWAYHVAPWWAFLHFLVQATTILLLHLSVEDFKTAQPSEGSSKYTAILADVITASERAMNWLHCLKRTDEAAKRAFERLNDCVERIKSQKGLYMNGFYLKDAYRTTTIVPLHAQSGISGDLSDKSSSQGLETFCPTPQNEDAQIEKKNSSAFRQWSEVPGVALDDLQYPFGVIGDSDMSGYIQHRTDSMLSELLSSLGVPPSQSFDEL